jgi:UMF1 family MFS transporter
MRPPAAPSASSPRPLFTLCIAVATPLVAEGDAQRWGILGIMVVLLAGLLVLLPVKAPSDAEIAVVPQS